MWACNTIAEAGAPMGALACNTIKGADAPMGAPASAIVIQNLLDELGIWT